MKKEQNLKIIDRNLFNVIKIKEINKQKLQQNSFIKKNVFNINPKGNKNIIYNISSTNNYSKNSISNKNVSVKSLIPKNNVITSQNNLYNKLLMNSNKIKETIYKKLDII